jgi:hypothetical protein
MNPLCIIIACIILLANNNPMKSFKQYLTEQQEKIKVTKPQPNIGSGQVKAQVREEEPPKEKEPTKPAELKTTQTEDPFGGNETVKKLYGAFAAAEHRGAKVENPFEFNEKLFIRTRGDKSSSAYGPVQMTTSTVSGFLKNNPNDFKGIEDYTQKFIQQGKKMLKAKEGDPNYSLGCKGDLCDAKYNTEHQRMAAAVIRGKSKEVKVDLNKPVSAGDLEKIVDHWRYGSGSGKSTKQSDKAYYDAFMAAYNSQSKSSG